MSNDMNNRAAHMRPTLLTPISSPVSAGSARNETPQGWREVFSAALILKKDRMDLKTTVRL